jgi:hypothetical protein
MIAVVCECDDVAARGVQCRLVPMMFKVAVISIQVEERRQGVEEGVEGAGIVRDCLEYHGQAGDR